MGRINVKYLGISNIATQFWCHEKARIKCIEEGRLFKDQVNKIKISGVKNSIEHPGSLFFTKAKILRITYSAYLSMLHYSLISRDDFMKLKTRDVPNAWRFIDGNGVMFKSHEKSVVWRGHAYRILRDEFNRWKSNLVNNEFEYLNIDTDCPRPWEFRLDDLILKKTNAPLIDGLYYEAKYGEKYPRIEKFFKWRDYVVVGIPDGITNKFCYEFKSVSNRHMSAYVKPIAIAQATLYAYFFKRKKIRVQLYCKDTRQLETICMNADRKYAVKILSNINNLIKNVIVPIEPKKFKCKNCTVKSKCRISNN